MSQIYDTTFRYNDAEFPFDYSDADNMDAMDNAVTYLQEAEPTLPKTGKASEIIRAQCAMYKRFFDIIFGDGAGDKICTERSVQNICEDAYLTFLEFVNTQKDNARDSRNARIAPMNRQQRRAMERAAAKKGKVADFPAQQS